MVFLSFFFCVVRYLFDTDWLMDGLNGIWWVIYEFGFWRYVSAGCRVRIHQTYE